MAELQKPSEPINFVVSKEDVGKRVDTFLSEHLEITRSHLKKIIDGGLAQLNDDAVKKGWRLEEGDRLSVVLPPRPTIDLTPRPVEFGIIYEDDSLIVVDKPADLSVHPAVGQSMTTLVHGLLHRFPELADSSENVRPGIVHRLDRFTSGVLLVAKTSQLHEALSNLFASREVSKTYHAIVEGVVEFDQNRVVAPIARHGKFRERMEVVQNGKEAQTEIDVLERFDKQTFVICRPKQGRRHQIRVHCQHLGHRILCDVTYGGTKALTEETLRGRPYQENQTIIMNRLALHAHKIEFIHPFSNEPLTFTSDHPKDFATLLDYLRLK